MKGDFPHTRTHTCTYTCHIISEWVNAVDYDQYQWDTISSGNSFVNIIECHLNKTSKSNTQRVQLCETCWKSSGVLSVILNRKRQDEIVNRGELWCSYWVHDEMIDQHICQSDQSSDTLKSKAVVNKTENQPQHQICWTQPGGATHTHARTRTHTHTHTHTHTQIYIFKCYLVLIFYFLHWFSEEGCNSLSL